MRSADSFEEDNRPESAAGRSTSAERTPGGSRGENKLDYHQFFCSAKSLVTRYKWPLHVYVWTPHCGVFENSEVDNPAVCLVMGSQIILSSASLLCSDKILVVPMPIQVWSLQKLLYEVLVCRQV